MINFHFSERVGFTFLSLVLIFLTPLAAQPALFDMECPGDGRNSQPIQATIEINGMNAVPGEDFVALFDNDGFVIGTGGVIEDAVFCNRSVTLVNFGVFGVPPNDDAGCPDGFGANDDEVLSGLIYDGSEGEYYVLPGDLTYAAGEFFIIPSDDGELCTPVNGTVLPVVLTAFRGQVAGPKHIRLSWDVAREENVSHYEVQRSRNGHEWTALDDVAAAGNSETARHYNFDDLTPEGVRQFYRLRMVDLDGADEFSGIVITELEQTGERTVKTFPNPASSATRLSIQLGGAWNENHPVNAGLYDLNGRVVADYAFLHPGTTSVALPTSIKPGLYLLRVTQADAVFTHKISLR
ncbi:T9SS type A sorting domain-containing protein [Neolewinella aurantiaca]|uniref:T9SS type A sorting domain-containing protein n=1 Tax=Neolewinella aurantiaca TaxID=2602767 RepID=A0A5C7FMP1_9BACT|nr:T9SS type A sorting domain-containing protein [Neolewinella aurantiaca]TXF88739.1 T9SS type A sorting domain-containing protein [Neolewinella aurantiaca]